MKIKEIDGLPVLDAKRPVTLTITKSDVAKADVKEPAGCAVARACHRQLHAIEARVHLARVYVRTNKGNWLRYMTPRAMRSEIVAFDRGGGIRAGRIHALGAVAHEGARQAARRNQAVRQARQETPEASRRYQRADGAGVVP